MKKIRKLALLLLLAVAGCVEAHAEEGISTVSRTSRLGTGDADGVFGDNLGSVTIFLTDQTLLANRQGLLFPFGSQVCMYCDTAGYIVHWQGSDDELSIDAARGTITDSCTPGAGLNTCGNDGRAAGVVMPANQLVCWRISRSSLQSPTKAGRRDGVCETASGQALSGIYRGYPCADDADCREGDLANDNACETTPGSFNRTTGTFLAGSGVCRGWWEK